MWSALLVNKILVGIAIIAYLLCFNDLRLLFKDLIFAVTRSRGAISLEHSVSKARLRNFCSASHVLPFCLIADYFQLYRPSFWTIISPEWSSLATIGVFTIYLILRRSLFGFFKISRLSSEEKASLYKSHFNYFIALVSTMFLSVCLAFALKLDNSLIRSILYIEIATFFTFSLFQSIQLLLRTCSLFPTFLYLCALELLPASIVVVSNVVF